MCVHVCAFFWERGPTISPDSQIFHDPEEGKTHRLILIWSFRPTHSMEPSRIYPARQPPDVWKRASLHTDTGLWNPRHMPALTQWKGESFKKKGGKENLNLSSLKIDQGLTLLCA